jgi:hypothetical protein
MRRNEQKREDDNDFGASTYWNRPSKTRRHTSRYANFVKITSRRSGDPTPSLGSNHTSRALTPPLRVPSPTPSEQSQGQLPGQLLHSSSVHTLKYNSKKEENDAKDDKAIQKIMKSTLPKFSELGDCYL